LDPPTQTPKVRRWRATLLRLALSLLLFLGILEVASCVYLKGKDLHVLRVFENSSSGGIRDIGIRKNFEQVWKQPEFTVTVRTNNIGLREDFDHRGESVDVGFFGDSFTFGHGVNAGERYSDRLRGLLPGKYVVTFSYLNGYTTPHYYVFLKDNPELAPHLSIVGLFLGNDLTGDMEETELVKDAAGELTSVVCLARQVDRRGFLVTIDVNPVTRALRRSWLGEVLLRERVPQRVGIEPRSPARTLIDPGWDLDKGRLPAQSLEALEYVARMRDLLAARGKRLIVFLIPWSYYVGPYAWSPHDAAVTADIRKNLYLPKAVSAWCKARGVECIDPIARFQEIEANGVRLYFAHDAHWNVEGHRVAADVIGAYLRENPTAPGR
jgi:hypothetical protein